MRNKKFTVDQTAKRSLKLRNKMAELQNEINSINKITTEKIRFGNFELKITNSLDGSKIEIEDIVYRTVKHLYKVGSYEFGLIQFLLGKSKQTSDGVVDKTEKEMIDGKNNVEFLCTMMANTNLIFSNEDFRTKYYNLITEVVEKQKADKISKKENTETLDELQKVEKMKEVIAEGAE